MTVYVEVVILNNLLIDLLLEATTSVARRRKIHKWRQFFAAIVGTGAATAYVILPPVSQIIIRILLAPIIVIIFDKYANCRDYLKSLAVFVVLTFLLGGIVTGVSNLTGIDPSGYVVFGLVALAMTATELAVRTIVLKRSTTARIIKQVTVGYKGKIASLNALYDSGNSLTDTITCLPVAILSKRGEKILSGLDAVNIADYEGLITAKTASGECDMPLIRTDGFIVDGENVNALIALSKTEFADCDIILNNTMFKGKYDSKKDNKKHTSVSRIVRFDGN